jgi:hypothetical protein
MTLQEFKTQHGITTIKFYDSKSLKKDGTPSNRKVSSLPNGELIVTKEEFNAGSPAFVYTVNPSPDNELDATIHVVSNTAPKAPTLEL